MNKARLSFVAPIDNAFVVRARERLAMTQLQFAKRLGISERQLRRLENNKSRATIAIQNHIELLLKHSR
jgi:transcriptional regulator with XRE-family HTH domain